MFIKDKAFRKAYMYDETGKILYGGLLEPSFWKALRDALGIGELSGMEKEVRPWWLETQHNFIDHLAKGKSPESFFTKLISSIPTIHDI